MKIKIPRRIGIRKRMGRPVYMGYHMIQSGKQIKSLHFQEGQLAERH